MKGFFLVAFQTIVSVLITYHGSTVNGLPSDVVLSSEDDSNEDVKHVNIKLPEDCKKDQHYVVHIKKPSSEDDDDDGDTVACTTDSGEVDVTTEMSDSAQPKRSHKGKSRKHKKHRHHKKRKHHKPV